MVQPHRWQYNTAHALCMLDKAADTHFEYATINAVSGKNGYKKAPQCCPSC